MESEARGDRILPEANARLHRRRSTYIPRWCRTLVLCAVELGRTQELSGPEPEALVAPCSAFLAGVQRSL